MATGFPEFRLGSRHILADAEPVADDGVHRVALFVDNASDFPRLCLGFQRVGKENRDEWAILETYWSLQRDHDNDYRHIDNVLYREKPFDDLVATVGEGLIYDYLPRVNAKLAEILGEPGEDTPPTDGGEEVEGINLLYKWLEALRFQDKRLKRVD